MQKTNQTGFIVEKVIERKVDKLYVKLKDYDHSFNSWIDKKRSLYKTCFFPEPYTCSKNKIKVELDLPNYATKSDSKKQQAFINQNLLKRLI